MQLISVGLTWKSAAKSNEKLVNQKSFSPLVISHTLTDFKLILLHHRFLMMFWQNRRFCLHFFGHDVWMLWTLLFKTFLIQRSLVLKLLCSCSYLFSIFSYSITTHFFPKEWQEIAFYSLQFENFASFPLKLKALFNLQTESVGCRELNTFYYI